MLPFSRRALLAALVLATGCRSEQVTFSFSAPAPPAVAAAPADEAAVVPATHPAALPLTRTAAPFTPLVPGRKARPTRPAWARTRLALRPRHPETAARPVPTRRLAEGEPEHPTLHLILGGLLVAAGVVGGILLGGWLGLGVGAAVVLGGYYFLGLAFGGKHAWLGVFQEFFNM